MNEMYQEKKADAAKGIEREGLDLMGTSPTSMRPALRGTDSKQAHSSKAPAVPTVKQTMKSLPRAYPQGAYPQVETL